MALQTYPGKNASLAGEALIATNDRHRFRLMAAHRDLWWPVLAEQRRFVLWRDGQEKAAGARGATALPGTHLR